MAKVVNTKETKKLMREKLEKVYQDIELCLIMAPEEDDCTDEENEMYADMSNLRDSMYNAGYFPEE